MIHRPQNTCATVLLGLFVALASTFMGCTFGSPEVPDTPESINALLYKAPVRSLEEGSRWTVSDVPGTLSVQHGYGCLQQGFALTEDYVGFRVQDMAVVPRSVADAGTVILNGWDVQYTDGDHHVAGLGAVIFNITEERTEEYFALRWDAGGVLSDKDGYDGYRWCYRYTLVFWNRGTFNAVVPYQHDVATTFVQGAYAENGTALLDLPGQVAIPSYGGPGVVLPRGVGLSWTRSDHHVLQVAFDLGPSTPLLTGNGLAWTAQTILKDNSAVDNYYGAVLVTALTGTSVEMWQPPTVLHWAGAPPSWVPEPTALILSPDAADCDGLAGAAEELLESYSVENVPFDYAVPVLTGWDLSYVCTDHHVERMGAYLVEFDYVKEPNANTGTLNYTVFSTLRDESDNGHAARYKVNILGLNAMEGR